MISWTSRRPTRFLRREKSVLRPRRVVAIPSAAVPPGGGWGGPGVEPTAAVTGAPGYWLPAGSNFPDLAAVQASGLTMNPEMDTVGHHLILGDGSHCHFRLGVWNAGDV